MTPESDPLTPPIQQPMAITPGDPCGIGPEIIAKAWCLAPESTQGCFVAGDVGLMRRAMALVQAVPTFPVCEIQAPLEALHVPPRCLPVLQVVPVAPVLLWGQIDARAGQLAGEAVLWATRAALQGQVAALVTAPLHKGVINDAGRPFTGHTEYLAEQTATPRVVMMLASPLLRVVPVTIHIPLCDVPDALTADLLEDTLRITEAGLRRDFGIAAPRLAVAGLNPHAGEGGAFLGQHPVEHRRRGPAQFAQRLRQHGVAAVAARHPGRGAADD